VGPALSQQLAKAVTEREGFDMTTTTLAPAGPVHDGDGEWYCGQCLDDLPGEVTCPACGPVGTPAAEPAPAAEAAPVTVPAEPAAPVAAEAALSALISAGWPGTLAGGTPPGAPAAGLRPDDFGGIPSMDRVPERPMIPLDLGAIPLILPRGDAALLYGRGAIGKGRLSHSLIAEVTRRGGDVVGIWPEDTPEQLRARIEAAGGDPARVWNMTKLGDGTRFKLSASARDEGHISLLRAFIKYLRDRETDPRDVQLVIIDPVTSVVGWGSIQTVAGARRFVEPVQDLADTDSPAVLLIGHPNKAGKLAGSEGLRDALRVIYEVTVDPVNAAYRVVTMEKGNDLTGSADGLRFTITPGPGGRPRVEWVTRASMEAERGAWRDKLAAERAPLPVTRFAAAWAAQVPGGEPDAHSLGPWPSLEAAKGACEDRAGQPLVWRASAACPGALTAVTHPGGPAGPEVSYAVSNA
jgi:KaiC/GvpD/RAD55 family RecA-like ATPase